MECMRGLLYVAVHECMPCFCSIISDFVPPQLSFWYAAIVAIWMTFCTVKPLCHPLSAPFAVHYSCGYHMFPFLSSERGLGREKLPVVFYILLIDHHVVYAFFKSIAQPISYHSIGLFFRNNPP